MKLKKGDIVVIALCFVLFLVSVLFCFLLKKSGKKLNVYENNKLVYSGNLSEDKEINLTHNTIVVKDGKAFMEKSDCKNQICVKTGIITKSRECIVCLPNKVIIEIE